MTKHLRFLIVLLMTLVWSTGGAQTTIDFTKVAWNNGYTQAPFSFKAAKGNGGTNPTQSAAKDIRLYAKNTLTVSTTGNKITKIVFSISKQGKEQWADLKSTSGSVVADKAKYIATWENAEGTTSVTFTVGDKCKYGTATTKAGQFCFNSVVIYELSEGPAKTPTKVSFDSNSGTTFTFTEGVYANGTFTAPTATEAKGVEGTIVYSSDNESAVKVNPSTGALSFPGYGEATITATFTPTDAETYAVSTDSYKVINNQKVDESVIVFSAEAKSFESIVADNGYDVNKGKIDFIATNGKKYTFDVQRALKNKGQLQLNNSTVTSPDFPDFTNGYKVTIQYNTKKATITLSSGVKSVTGTNNDKTILLDVQDGSAFKINVNDKALYISKIEIVPNNVIFEETATNNNIVAKTGVNVTLKRSMVENEWNTICLPFNVTAEQAKTAFGEGVMIAQLNKNSSGNKLSFSSVDAIVASTPYLIKPTIAAPADGYKFEGVTINDDGKGNVAPNVVNTNSYLAFVGIYNTVDVTNNVIEVLNNNYYAAFLGANNTIFKAKNDGGKMKGFRAYFAIPNNVAASALCVMVNGTTTSIKSINSEVVESNAPVYNLQGQRVDGNNLTPGIYVKAGKKFVVR